ncbi:hypothetical protein V1264_003792 [Littorina saxatilis]|uniref:Uncharacterized protein n=1 Tax=Littorina saxatilis TaxID=31220 RepID=A0AAN9B0B9_9CAEN
MDLQLESLWPRIGVPGELLLAAYAPQRHKQCFLTSERRLAIITTSAKKTWKPRTSSKRHNYKTTALPNGKYLQKPWLPTQVSPKWRVCLTGESVNH